MLLQIDVYPYLDDCRLLLTCCKLHVYDPDLIYDIRECIYKVTYVQPCKYVHMYVRTHTYTVQSPDAAGFSHLARRLSAAAYRRGIRGRSRDPRQLMWRSTATVPKRAGCTPFSLSPGVLFPTLCAAFSRALRSVVAVLFLLQSCLRMHRPKIGNF